MRSAREERRERIATAALAGILADPEKTTEDPEYLAERAVQHADALMKKLDATAAAEEFDLGDPFSDGEGGPG